MSVIDTTTRSTNAALIAFDTALGTAALVAPRVTLAALGHVRPSEDACHLFRRCGPIWLTFAAAHLIASRRGRPEDWWALAWLRATEIATDVVWARSQAFRPGSRVTLRLAGGFNLAATIAFARLARAPIPHS